MEKTIRMICEKINALPQEQVILAVDGSCTAGKSTLAARLKVLYDCNVFHMDDFFLRPEQRTEERFAQPGGNVDYERFREEVLLPLQAQKPFSYRPFSCSTMSLAAPIHVVPRQLSIVEGAYSMHPALSDAYDLSVFLKIDAQIQEERILHRNGCQMQQRFLNEWIPLEKRYFGYFHIENQCSMSIDVT